MEAVFIGMGSNLNQPVAQLQNALRALTQLSQCQIIKCSSLYLSKAIGPGQQDDYVNAVIQMYTDLSPLSLLTALQGIEDQQNRTREIRWGPRTLDLDILLFGSQSINSEQLTVPHSELHNRSFVLYPLMEIAPELKLPNRVSLSALVASCPFENIERIDPTIASLNQTTTPNPLNTCGLKRASNA